MRYRLEILSTTGPLTVHSVLFTPDIRVESYSKRINAPGRMVFSIRATNPKATDDRLMPYRRVRLYRETATGFRRCWFGYIEDTNEVGGWIDVICNGMLGFFAKRTTTVDETFTGEGSTEAFDLLADCNDDGDTGVSAGTGGVTSTKNLETNGRIEVLKAWELLAQAHGAEFEIDDDGVFHFVPTLGTDLSSSVTLIYRRDGSPGSTVRSIEIGANGREMATRVIGTTSGGLEYEYNATTQSTYGVITEIRAFNEAGDLGTLQSMAEAYGSQRERPIPDFRVLPENVRRVFSPRTGTREVRGLDYFDSPIGSLLGVQIVSENRSITTAKRIAEIVVTVDENGTETVSYTLSEAGVFVTAGYLDATRVDELVRRVAYLESVL